MSSRRKFIRQSAALLAGSTVLQNWSQPLFARNPPASQLNIAVIGAKGMGWSNTRAAMKIPGVNLVAICDVDQSVINDKMAELQKQGINTGNISTGGDYRRLLDNKDIDIIIVGTPDHWHALQTIHALEAGKHVYVEKPVGNSIGECAAMVKAQQRYGKLVQAGQWQRSQQHFKDAVEFVHSGQLGMIRTVKVWCYQGWMRPQPVVPDSAPPAGVDYKTWLGPAPLRPFNTSRFHFHFRWFWDYAGGLMTDWGVHLLDYALLGMKAEVPKTIAALGGRFAYPELYEETPDTLTTLYEFDGFNMVWDSAMGIDNGSYGRNHGIAFIGNNGTLVLDRGGWEVLEEKQSKNKVLKPLVKSSDNGLEKHWVNFTDAIRNNQPNSLHCPLAAAAHVANVAQMGNIAYRSGQKLSWNKEKSRFTQKEINRQYLVKEYHNGYKLPVV
ncbi:MAG: Gfo/Idh/MocA family oxidoreductase [Sphingobacteriales bacterium]|nr:Gfo/Idh/MocA family oxidoreductase [Sphingobacteriales bacterium]OJW32016.1 MAG: oxidoreductase [Sphingobacteriales bacterium 46-32]